MRFKDTLSGDIYTLQTLYRDYVRFRTEDPDLYPDSFQIELLNILLATINGGNDLEVIGLSPAELNRFILRLWKKLSNQFSNKLSNL